MAEAVTAKPVPIRLAYRYPNGSMVSYSARAIARDEQSVRVIVNEEFEEGITLAVMAPFLQGLTTGRVSSVANSKKQPGYFEIVLRFGEKTSTSASLGNGRKLGAGLADATDDAGVDSHEADAGQPKTARIVPEQVVEAAEKLAYELGKLPGRHFSRALAEIPVGLRPLALLVGIAATMHLLQEKGLTEAHRLLSSAKEAVKK